MEIKDKIIVITGGSSGIGKALSDILKKDNTVVSLSRSGGFDREIVSYAKDGSDSGNVKSGGFDKGVIPYEKDGSDGGNAKSEGFDKGVIPYEKDGSDSGNVKSGGFDKGIISYAADVSDYDRLKEVFSEIGERFGKIDVLINSAGYGLSGITEYIPHKEAEKITAVNYLGVLFSSQLALKYMERGAKIINIGSLGGVSPMPFRALYNSSKAAAHMLSLSMNAETRPLGISVCAVKLGDTATNFKDNRKKLGVSGTRYGDAAENVDAFVDSRGAEKKMPTVAAAEKIIRILKKNRIKAFYIFGIKYKSANVLNALAPGAVTKIVYRIMAGKPKK
jgi:NAD(P)-dependent dehydrogenase (short-subunit alcohol dehydrogenase family)